MEKSTAARPRALCGPKAARGPHGGEQRSGASCHGIAFMALRDGRISSGCIRFGKMCSATLFREARMLKESSVFSGVKGPVVNIVMDGYGV
ncbi:MAG: hypothetical protein LBD67_07270, partial [Candidatus Accumulibacter sp.]|nr:hypothetical protein [Accumulibacter sp.]